MKIDQRIIDRVNTEVFLQLPESRMTGFREYNEDKATKVIKSRPYSIVGLVMDKDVVVLSDNIRHSPAGKFAAILNLIIMDHFDSLQAFFDTFGLTAEYMDLLWQGQVLQPHKETVISLVKSYDINPMYLYGTLSEPYLSVN